MTAEDAMEIIRAAWNFSIYGPVMSDQVSLYETHCRREEFMEEVRKRLQHKEAEDIAEELLNAKN